MEGLNRRGAYDVFPTTLKKIRKRHDSHVRHDAGYHRMRYSIEEAHQQFLIQHPGRKPVFRTREMIEAFPQTWMLELFAMGLVVATQTGEEESKIHLQIRNLLKDLDETALQSGMPLLSIYRDVYKLSLRKAGAGSFRAILMQMIAYDQDFPNDPAIKTCATAMVVYLVKRVKSIKDKELRKVLLATLDWGIQRAIVYDEYLGVNNLGLFIALALEFKKTDKVRAYIEAYLPKLSPQYLEESKRYYAALIHFHQGAFRIAMDLMNQNYQHAYYERHARWYLLQLYYELLREDLLGDNWAEVQKDLLKQAMDFRRFVKESSKVAAAIKPGYYNWVQCFKKLVRARSPKAYREVQDRINQSHPITNPKWLLEKCEAEIKREVNISR